MAGQQQHNQDRTQVAERLDWVHRHARPRAGVNVAVMHCVHMLVDRGLVQGEVHHIKVKALPERQDRKQRDEPDGMGAKRQGVDQSAGIRPPQETFEH